MLNIKENPEDFIVEEVIDLELSGGDYNYFKLTKENRNTLDVIKQIARRVPRKSISFAGAKDKIAITTQYISIYKLKPNVDLEGVKLEYVGSGPKPINLGALKGNKFKIKIDFIPKKVNKIINYFGPQRFGKQNKEIGKAIIKKDFKEVTKLLELESSHNNYLEAIQKIDRRLLSLYIHSYQSYLWNEVVKVLPKKNQEIPLLSFDTKFKNKSIENAYEKILKIESITKKDFIIRQMPDITPISTTRPMIVEVKDFQFKKPFIYFFLPKGSYATIALEQIQ